MEPKVDPGRCPGLVETTPLASPHRAMPRRFEAPRNNSGLSSVSRAIYPAGY